MYQYLIVYVILINAIALYVMYIDKNRAKRHQYRIQEKTLWTVSFLGGALGAFLGMEWFRHKTKHPNFKWGLPALTVVEIAIIIYIFRLSR